jgi:hypothetical protein
MTFYHLPKSTEQVFDQAQVDACLARVRTFIQGAQAYFATGVTADINNQVDVLDAFNGELLTTFVGAAPTPVTVSSAGVPYAPANAILLKYKTSGIVHGHAVKGRTFISPIAAGMISSGVVVSGAITGLPSLAGALITGSANEPRLAIWSRPVKVAKATVPVRDGSAHLVTSSSVPAKVAVLRSRRD